MIIALFFYLEKMYNVIQKITVSEKIRFLLYINSLISYDVWQLEHGGIISLFI